MMKSKLQRIDDSLIKEHSYLEGDDECLFYGDYTPREGYGFSEMNNLIINFKKPMTKKKNPMEWRHKEKATKEIAEIIVSLESWEELKKSTWVPIPPSKKKDDPLYDDRLIQVLDRIQKREASFDFRELVLALKSRNAASSGGVRLVPDGHYRNWKINENLIMLGSKNIVVFDDIITTGSSFKGMKRLLKETFPNVKILGVFIARRAFQGEADGL